MRIELDERYIVQTNEPYGFTLKEKAVTKKGKEIENNIAYYGNLQQLYEGLMQKNIELSKAETIKEIDDLIKAKAKEFEKKVKEKMI